MKESGNGIPNNEMENQRSLWVERATRFEEKGELRRAAMAYRRAVLETPSSSRLMSLFSGVLEKINPYSPFREYALKATVLRPTNSKAWHMRARGLLNQRDLGASATCVQRAIVLDPNRKDGYLTLARVLFQRINPLGSLRILTYAARLTPFSNDVHIALARCLFRLDRPKDALAAADMARHLGAERARFGFDHARIARAAEREDLATPMLAQLLVSEPGFAMKIHALDYTARVSDLKPKSP